jgi:membrane peptidoglycan carboxypeptidase
LLEFRSEMDVWGTDEKMTCRQISVNGNVNPHLRLSIRLLITMLAGALAITAIITAMAPQAWGILHAHSEDPVALSQFSGLAQRSILLDVNGQQVGVFQVKNTQQTPISAVPDAVKNAFIAVEDSVFYEHDGVNLRAVGRALLANSQGGGRQGASTITQQVIKNELLGGKISGSRLKLLQIRGAVMLEKQLSKEEILERYLNTVFFGNNAYGLQAAAEVYFGTSVQSLSQNQGAFLAGMVQAPSSRDPFTKPDSSRYRYKQVLSRLVEVGEMTPEQATLACKGWESSRVRTVEDADCPIPDNRREISRATDTGRTYFSEAVRDYLLNRSDILGATYEERYNKLFHGGLVIHTTLDKGAQVAAEKAALEQMPENSANIQAAVVSVDNATGGVRAMVGGRDFLVSEVNVAMRRRQTGSSVKMFILAAAMEAGLLPEDVIDGTLPCTLPNPGNDAEPTFLISNGVSQPVSSLRTMTALSINCAYARLAQVVGLDKVVALMYGMMSSDFLPKPEWGTDAERLNLIKPYASLSTGANELSPLDMASGAQTIANMGVHLEPYFVEKIEDATGVIYQHEAIPDQALSEASALRAVDTLKGVLTIGTARRSQLAGGRPAAGKTGTQDDNTNAWFVGFSRELTTAVWVGDPRAYTPMVNIPEFVKTDGYSRIQGAMYPARIWKQMMDEALGNVPVNELSDWPAPPPAVANEARPDLSPQRIYLPGNECLAQVVSGTIPTPPTTTLVKPKNPTTVPVVPNNTVVVSIVEPPALPVVSTSSTSTTTTTTIPGVVTPSTTPSKQYIKDRYPAGPVNTVPIGAYWVYNCEKGLPPSVVTSIAG